MPLIIIFIGTVFLLPVANAAAVNAADGDSLFREMYREIAEKWERVDEFLEPVGV